MLSHAAIVGNPEAGIYSQTFTSGNFFIVLSLEGEKVDLELGRNTLAKIEEIISQTPGIAPSELVEIQKEEFGDGFNLNILVGRIENQTLYLAGTGEVGAKIIRKGKIINLSAPNLSGTLLHHDLLVLATQPFFTTIAATDLMANGNPVTEIRDQFLPKIESVSESSKIAALLIKMELQEEVESMPVVSPQSPIAPPRSLFLARRTFHLPEKLANRRILYLLLLVAVFLISLVVFQLRSKVLEKQNTIVSALETKVQDGESNADKLTGLNDSLARGVLVQTRADLVVAADQAFGKKWPPKLQKILADLDKKITAVSHVYQLSSLDVFYDFSLLKAGAKINSLWSHEDEVVGLDPGNGAVYSLNLETKGAAIITGSDDLKAGKFVDFAKSQVFVWTPTGIILIDRSSSPAVTKQLVKSSEKWGTIRDLKTFAGNIYLLDASNNQIWKYQKTDLGFTDVTNYLHTGLPLDFANVNQMAIEGSIFVLTTTGNIAQFAQGSPLNFQITGLDGGLIGPTGFFTTDETDNIYVLDTGGKRVVVLSKKGVYQAAYLLPDTFSNLAVSEKLKKAFLFSGPKVSSFNLQ